MGKTASFLVGVVIGGIVGSGVALLLAPESGEELRLEIKERYQDLATEIRRAAVSKRIELQERLATMRETRV